MKECERMSQKERKKNTILEKMKKDSNAPDSKKICRQQRMDVSESKHSTMMEDCSHRAELMAWWSMCDVQGGRGGTLTFVFCIEKNTRESLWLVLFCVSAFGNMFQSARHILSFLLFVATVMY